MLRRGFKHTGSLVVPEVRMRPLLEPTPAPMLSSLALFGSRVDTLGVQGESEVPDSFY